jgi:cell wall-associated NlpC family hydrolase
MENGGLRLPDGGKGRVVLGAVRAIDDVLRTSRAVSPDLWAWRAFRGAPYLWGGVTPAGVDCSGLTQTTFAARGIALPRDAWQQASAGEPVSPLTMQPGDLCFFRGETSERITHVALYAGDHTMVHSTVSRGAVVRERWAEGDATDLHDRLVAVRRIPEAA